MCPDGAQDMRWVRLYLVGYALLVIGALLALWQSGVLRRIPLVWLGIGLIIVIGLGIMLAVASSRPGTTIKTD